MRNKGVKQRRRVYERVESVCIFLTFYIISTLLAELLHNSILNWAGVVVLEPLPGTPLKSVPQSITPKEFKETNKNVHGIPTWRKHEFMCGSLVNAGLIKKMYSP